MIGKRIKRLRLQKGYSITELGRLADVSKSYLSQIERGMQTNPSMQFLIKLSIPLGTDINYLLKDSKTQQHADSELDDEWKVLVKQAMESGLKKEDFHEYQNYLKFQAWLKEQNKT